MRIEKNKYLTFLIGDECYGIKILKVKEIIGLLPITHVPKMPKYIKGIINLRGKIIPVIDLRLSFQMKERTYDDRTCIIVVETNNEKKGMQLRGIIVDTISEVIDIKEEDIEIPSAYVRTEKEAYISGIGKSKEKDRVTLLLEIDNILKNNV